MKKYIKYLVPGFIKKRYVLTGKNETPLHGWFGSYSSWSQAQSRCSGYDSKAIIDKVKSSILKVKAGEAEYERDSVAFKQHEYSEDVLNALRSVVKNNELNIIDFGGSLGSTYFQYRRFFNGVHLNWMVVEQDHFVETGNQEIGNSELRFFKTIEEALKYKKSEGILLSSVLPYLEKPYECIKKVKDFNFETIIIDRNAFMETEKDILTVQVVPEFIYKASYPAWFFNKKKFLVNFLDKYEVKNEFLSPFALPAIVNEKKAYWKGYLLKLKK